MNFGRAWAVPLFPLCLWLILLASGKEVEVFLWLNQAAQVLPNWAWAWFTFLGNGWGIFSPVSYTHLTLPTNREV